MPKPIGTSGVVVHADLMQLTTHLPKKRRSSRPAKHHHGGPRVRPPHARRAQGVRPGGQRALLLHVRLRLHGGRVDLGRLPALRDRAGLVAAAEAHDARPPAVTEGRQRSKGAEPAGRAAFASLYDPYAARRTRPGDVLRCGRRRQGRTEARTKRARGIEPPFLAWEANVLAIGQRPRRVQSIPGARSTLCGDARPRLLARHHRRGAARRPPRLWADHHRDRHHARRRDGPRRARRAAAGVPAAAPGRRRDRLARRLQGQGRAGQRVGVVVRAVPRRAAADREGPQDALGRGRDGARDRRQGEHRRRDEGGRRVRPDVPEPARPRRQLRPQVGPDRLSRRTT